MERTEQGVINSTSGSSAGQPTQPRLLPHHLDQLRASGLTDETIAAAGLFSMEDSATAYRVLNLWDGAESPVPGLAFPYPCCDEYVRLRPDKSVKRNPDDQDLEVHGWRPVHPGDREPEFVDGPKYLSPRGAPTRLYAAIALRPEILDPSVPLYLVEGEKKALAACQSGLAAVAAPGVFCFGDSAVRRWAKGIGEDVRKLHPDFEHLGIPLKGRKVIVLFDSDIDLNPKVLAAAASVGKMLTEAGAIPYIAYVPHGTDQQKVGLDDYLASLPEEQRRGRFPLGAVEDSARPFNVQDCLDDFLTEGWRDWNRQDRDQELGRAVRLASHLMRGKKAVRDWCKRVARELHEDPDHVQSFIVEVSEPSDRDPRHWLAAWLARNRVEHDRVNNVFTMRGQTVDTDILFREMALDSDAHGGPRRESLNDALTTWIAREQRASLDLLRTRLRYSPDLGKDELRKFVRAVTGAEDPVEIAVFAHFIWQVKRKLFDLEVEHHLMLILAGLQDLGKSTAVRKYVSPVAEFVDSMGDLGVLNDERQVFRMAKCLVAFVDEMAKAEKVDMASLKSRITAPTVSWRVLGSNRRSSGKNLATFIGTANLDLPDLIIDTTGVRRFFSVDCKQALDWEVINAIDYVAMWTSVDEAARTPLLSVLPELRRRQEEWRIKDAVEEFVALNCTVGTGDWMSASDAFKHFKIFLDHDNRPRHSWNETKFGRRLKEVVGLNNFKKSGRSLYQLTITPMYDDLEAHRVRVAPEEEVGAVSTYMPATVARA